LIPAGTSESTVVIEADRSVAAAPRTRLVGRRAELAWTRRVLDVASPVPAVVLRGEPGVGKSALLDAVVELAPPDTLVLRTAGVGSESAIGYAGLHRLLCGLLPWTASVPPPQRAALRTAFGMDEGPPPDRFHIGLATLTVLTELAVAHPVLCVIDDAQWIDRESLDALAFMARRLLAERVAVVFAERDGAVPDALAGLPSLQLAGLDDAAGRELLGELYGEPIEARLAQQIVGDLGGNPLALHELAVSCVDVDRLARHGVQPSPLPAGELIERHYGGALLDLSSAVNDLLLVLAADRTLDLHTFQAAAARLGVDAGSIGDVEECALIEVDGVLVGFRHPLVRSACYRAASPTARRRAHALLSQLVGPGCDLERHAWHLALSAIEPDEEIAALLEAAARRAGARGPDRAHVELLLRAAELSPDAERRGRRHLRAATATGMLADHGRLTRLIAGARDTTADPQLLAEIGYLEALAPGLCWRYGSAAQRLTRAAVELDGFDRLRAREVALEAFAMLSLADPCGDGLSVSDLARAVRAMPAEAAGDAPGAGDLLLDGYADAVLDGWAAAAPSLKEAIRRWPADVGTAHRHLGLPVRAAFALWEHDGLQPAPPDARSVDRFPGALDPGRFELVLRARLEVAGGRFDLAEATASEIAELSAAMAAHEGWQVVGSAELLAWRGDEGETLAAVRLLQALARDQQFGYAAHLADTVTALLANGSRRYGDAAVAARRVARSPISEFASQALVELAEALVHLDEPGELAAVLAEIDVRARAGGSPLALGVSARVRAAATRGAEGEALFRRSIDLLAETSATPELARAHLSHGEWLRREKRPADAREHLRQAYERFLQLGAEAFAARARAELAAAGGRASRRTRASTDLTAQERQVATLAGQGQTNKEIATQLYLSASTVDFHLRKVYRKLGITSRRQLVHAGLE